MSPSGKRIVPLFALTLLVAAALLFAVQPMVTRMVLPTLGGSAAVWTTCSAFFQATVLVGYLYAHCLARLRSFGTQAIGHGVLLLLPLAILPIHLERATDVPTGIAPALWLLGRLATVVGLPLLAVGATAPLLQGWFARTGHPEASEPYFLYGASNLGSLGALLAYPLLIEPRLDLAEQTRAWAIGYGLLVGLILAAAACVAASRPRAEPMIASGTSVARRPSTWAFLVWTALGFVPSSLMLGVTAYLSADIAAVPLLWVVPLALYLVTFVLAFARPRPGWVARVAGWFPVALLALTPALAAGLVQWFWMPLHLATFFLAALACHLALAERRPPVVELTRFYLALALGGVLGGLFNALIAPVVFDRLAEYPLMLVLAGLLAGLVRPRAGGRPGRLGDLPVPVIVFALTAGLVRNVGGGAESVLGAFAVMLASGLVALTAWQHRSRPVRLALTLGAVLAACGLSEGVDGRALLRARNFYGTIRVTQDDRAGVRRLFHGTTLHGQQRLDPVGSREPQAYFERGGPAGDLFGALSARAGRRACVAVVGLGAGTLACYAEPGESWSFYEIDPAIARVATDPRFFTYLRDCRAGAVNLVLGDARLKLGEAAAAYELIVLDAFSSDAVPMHLLTREALGVYRGRLAGDGLIAFQISNRYLDLEPVLGNLARDAGLACRARHDTEVTAEQRRGGKQPSIWVVMAGNERDMGPLARDPRWLPARTRPGSPTWTDGRASLLDALRLGGG